MVDSITFIIFYMNKISCVLITATSWSWNFFSYINEKPPFCHHSSMDKGSNAWFFVYTTQSIHSQWILCIQHISLQTVHFSIHITFVIGLEVSLWEGNCNQLVRLVQACHIFFCHACVILVVVSCDRHH